LSRKARGALRVAPLRRQAEGWLLVSSRAGDVKVRADPFDAVEIELGSLWAR
jgi:hypothetical protein